MPVKSVKNITLSAMLVNSESDYVKVCCFFSEK